MAGPIELEAHHDLGSLHRAVRRIALVFVQMGSQLLLPGRTHPLCALSGPLHRRYGARASCTVSVVGVAVASAATDASEGAAWTVACSGSSFFGFLESSGATSWSGSSVSVGTAFGSSLGSTTAFCSTTAGEAAEASASGPAAGRSARAAALPLDSDLDRRRAQRLVVVLGPHIVHRQRDAAHMDGDGADRSKAPDRRRCPRRRLHSWLAE